MTIKIGFMCNYKDALIFIVLHFGKFIFIGLYALFECYNGVLFRQKTLYFNYFVLKFLVCGIKMFNFSDGMGVYVL